MREEYIIERGGKRFVVYAGLLEAAHARGLRSIETELLQVPAPENGEVAMVRAVVRTEERKFSGIGDASPANTSARIAPHRIRMAETRAKARALRDAINIGVTAFEELGSREEVNGDPAAKTAVTMETAAVWAGQEQQERRVSRRKADLPLTRKQFGYLEM